MNDPRMSGRRGVLTGAALLSLLAPTTACTAFGGYDVPDSVCGRPIAPEVLAPLLPEGENLKERHRSADEDASMCTLSVDGDAALVVEEWRDQEPRDMLEREKDKDPAGDPARSDVQGDSVISDGTFHSMNPCPARGEKSNHTLTLYLGGAGTGGKRDELEAFAAAYLPEGLKAMGCTE
ncbi:hypothetical protein [Streptomyces sp. C10-9-1]|uniref:hypothetical protein n=1 Tax=Streptomyces sp. C10-9-1 TaxID=1859285 RepID=UPI003D751D56